MNNLLNKKMIKILLETYNKRLRFFLKELDAYNDEGDVVLSQGLKVRHKESGLEYTVSGLVKDSGKEYFKLLLPDEARDGMNIQHGETLFSEDDRASRLRDRVESQIDSVDRSDSEDLDQDKRYILVSVEDMKKYYEI
jgi:hypothetical protein